MSKAKVNLPDRDDARDRSTSDSARDRRRAASLEPPPYGIALADRPRSGHVLELEATHAADHVLSMSERMKFPQILRDSSDLTAQAKLTVSQPGDPYEIEADRVAEEILSGPLHETITKRALPLAPSRGLFLRRSDQVNREGWFHQYHGPAVNPLADDFAVACLSFKRRPGEPEDDHQYILVPPLGRFIPEGAWDLDCLVFRDGSASKYMGAPAQWLGGRIPFTIQRWAPEKARKELGQYIAGATWLFNKNPPPKSSPESIIPVQRAYGARGEVQHESVQHQPATLAPEIVAAAPGKLVSDVLRHSGEPLPNRVRSFFEPRFGRDFSRVRVHTGSAAAASAQALRANAYAVGEHLVFDQGQFQPESSAGRTLLAHELTHVLQATQAAMRQQVADDGERARLEARHQQSLTDTAAERAREEQLQQSTPDERFRSEREQQERRANAAMEEHDRTHWKTDLTKDEEWLIQKESGFRTDAANPKSSAFGLGQLLRDNRERYAERYGFAPDTRDPWEQKVMFRAYIKERYGDAKKAREWWEKHQWY